MPKEFFASAKFKMKIPDGLTGVGGGLIIPSGISAHMLERRNLTRRYPHLSRRLLDPQLYLAPLNVSTCRRACTNLASYGWFPGASLPPFNSSEQKHAEWAGAVRALIHDHWTGRLPLASEEIEDTIRLCVEKQDRMGCEGIILPSPLTTDPASNYNEELAWLDLGLELGTRVAPGKARIATIAISDTCLRGIPASSNSLRDTIVDQVTARLPEGAYVVLEQANEDGYYCTHPNTVGALLRIVHGLKVGGVARVVVAFAGTAGLLALAVGADTWSTGWYRGERRLRLVDFEQHEGRSVPAYYSHSLGGEFHLEQDLERVARRGFLGRIADVTEASDGLIRALTSGASVSSVPDWQYRPSNVTASVDHFLSVMARETAVLAALSPDRCLEYAQRWLENADQLASDLYSVGSFNARTSLSHQRSWREAFTNFLASR